MDPARDRVAIRAAQPVAAVQARFLDGQLEEQRRVLTDLLRGDLIDGDAERWLCADFRECAAEECGGSPIVIAGGAAAARERVPQIADDVDLVVERFDRLKDFGSSAAPSWQASTSA